MTAKRSLLNWTATVPSCDIGNMRHASNVLVKTNKAGNAAYYWVPHWRDRRKGCPVRSQTLGADISNANSLATLLNLQVENWRNSRVILDNANYRLNVNSIELQHVKEESDAQGSRL